jgi:hypothetical protein
MGVLTVLGSAVAVMALAVATAGCGAGANGGGTRAATKGRTGARSNGASLRHQPVVTGVVRIDRSTLRAGAELRAELVLHNSSSRARVLARGCPHGFVQLVLSSRTLTASPLWALPACSDATFVARSGTTTYRLKVATTLLGCTMRGHQPSPGMPACLPGNRMPPLPAGTYAVSVAASSIQLQHELAHVRPAHVRVLR